MYKLRNQENRKAGKNEQSSTCRVRVRALSSISKFGYDLSERQGTALMAKTLLPGCDYIGWFYYALSSTNFDNSVNSKATTSRGEGKMAGQKGQIL